MKNNKLIIIVALAIVVVLVVVLLLSSSKATYDDVLSAQELMNIASAVVNTDGGTKSLDSDVILEFTEEDVPYLIDFIVIKANKAKNINEMGIFKVASGNADQMYDIVSNYVNTKQGIYRAIDYFPEEVEKIDCATVKIFGNYIIYSFLNESDTEAVYNAIENQLKK